MSRISRKFDIDEGFPGSFVVAEGRKGRHQVGGFPRQDFPAAFFRRGSIHHHQVLFGGAHLPDGGNTHIEPVIADEIQGIDGMRKRHGKPAGIQVRRTGKFPFVTGLLCRFYYCIETYPAASDFRIAANNGSTLVDGA